jgi:hypothetical protein
MPIRAALPLAVLLPWLALPAGCGSQSEPPPPPPVEETVFGEAVGTMDRARAVEDITQQQKRDLDAAIEASEGGRTNP